MNATIDGTLEKTPVEWEDNAAVCVVAASGGYPGKYQTGYEIAGLEAAEEDENVTVFHAGTSYDSGLFKTAGGRVLGVTAVDDDLDKAIRRTYAAVDKVTFPAMHFRKDIGIK